MASIKSYSCIYDGDSVPSKSYISATVGLSILFCFKEYKDNYKLCIVLRNEQVYNRDVSPCILQTISLSLDIWRYCILPDCRYQWLSGFVLEGQHRIGYFLHYLFRPTYVITFGQSDELGHRDISVTFFNCHGMSVTTERILQIYGECHIVCW